MRILRILILEIIHTARELGHTPVAVLTAQSSQVNAAQQELVHLRGIILTGFLKYLGNRSLNSRIICRDLTLGDHLLISIHIFCVFWFYILSHPPISPIRPISPISPIRPISPIIPQPYKHANICIISES